LPPEDYTALLAQRCDRLEVEISQGRSLLQLYEQRGLSRLFMIESEYLLAMREAELAWTRKLADEIRSGALGDLAMWAAFHRAIDQQGTDQQGTDQQGTDQQGTDQQGTDQQGEGPAEVEQAEADEKEK